jgi:hypothetical protein
MSETPFIIPRVLTLAYLQTCCDGCTRSLLSVLYGAVWSRVEALSPRDGDSLQPHAFPIRHRRGAGAPYKSCSERVRASFPFFLPSVYAIFRRLATPR